MKKINIFASTSDQIEGLKGTLKQFPFEQFLVSLDNLCKSKVISKSHAFLLTKRARKILGISFAEYKKKYCRQFP